MGTPAVAVAQERKFRLFNANAVGLAAFFFSPLAGAILIAVNYVRLGKTAKGVLAVIFGAAATALPILAKRNWARPWGSLGSLVLLTVIVFCVWQFAKDFQGDAIAEHTARGGQLGSISDVIGIGIATLAGFVVVIGALVYIFQHRKILVIGTKDQVIYSGLATKADATALGDALKNNGYFQERGASVLLERGFSSTTISFAVQNGIWNKPGMLASFEELVREVAPSVGGLPVQVQLIDTQENVEDTSTVGEVRFDGRDAIYYEGSAAKAEAEALGRRFQSMGFFRGKGVSVFLVKHDDEGTTITFVVVGDSWKDPKRTSALADLVREVAPTVGGLPIDMHLVNSRLELQKEERIE